MTYLMARKMHFRIYLIDHSNINQAEIFHCKSTAPS
jgi:hypothetical protein